ncbi:MAG: acyl dehydratase [Ilumatobacteraceae bacterium]
MSREELLRRAGLDPELAPVGYAPTRLQLFRFSAVTWNAHRIHYDELYARSEGHGGVVVHSTLRGQQLLGVALRWMGDHGEVSAFAWRNLRPAFAGEHRTCRGDITSVTVDSGSLVVTITLDELDDAGDRGATGSATVRIPVGDRQ